MKMKAQTYTMTMVARKGARKKKSEEGQTVDA